jgi:hypothetical protein
MLESETLLNKQFMPQTKSIVEKCFKNKAQKGIAFFSTPIEKDKLEFPLKDKPFIIKVEGKMLKKINH